MLPRGARVPTFKRRRTPVTAGLVQGLRYGGGMAGRIAAAAAAGSKAARQVAAHLHEAQAREEQRARAVAMARSRLAVDATLDRLYRDYSADSEGFLREAQRMRRTWLDERPGGEDRAERALYFDRAVSVRHRKIQIARHGEQEAETNAVFTAAGEQAVRAMQDAAFVGEAGAALAFADEAVTALAARTDLAPPARAKAGSALQADLFQWTVRGAFHRAVEAGGAAAGSGFIDRFMASDRTPVAGRQALAPVLRAELRDVRRREAALARQASAQAHQARAMAFQAYLSEAGSGASGEADVAGLAGSGLLTPNQYRRLVQAVDKAEKERIDSAARTDLVLGVFGGDIDPDPADRGHEKAFNWFWDTRAAADVAAVTDPAARNAATARFVHVSRFVPDAVAGWLRSALLSEDPEAVVRAVDLVQRIDGLPGDPLGRAMPGALNDRDLARARMVGGMVRAGVAPEAAIRRAASLVDPENAALTALRERAFEAKDSGGYEIGRLTAAALVRDVLDHGRLDHGRLDHGRLDHGRLDHGRLDHGRSPARPAMPPRVAGQLAADANRLFRRHYLLTGDARAARIHAERQIARTWAITAVNGRDEVMWMAPELFYRLHPGDDGAWIRADLAASIVPLVGRDNFHDRVVVTADERTARGEIVGPRLERSYAVMLRRGDDGTFVPVGDRDDTPVRWYPRPARRPAGGAAKGATP